ncbi:MAG: hypothetical protein ACJAT5_000279 [Lentimonas sp.]|jgi:hypothetical protein
MLGAGNSIGLLSQWTKNWRSQNEAKQLHYFLGQDNNLSQFTAKAAYTLNEVSALKLCFVRSREFKQSWNEINFQFQLFF